MSLKTKIPKYTSGFATVTHTGASMTRLPRTARGEGAKTWFSVYVDLVAGTYYITMFYNALFLAGPQAIFNLSLLIINFSFSFNFCEAFRTYSYVEVYSWSDAYSKRLLPTCQVFPVWLSALPIGSHLRLQCYFFCLLCASYVTRV